MGKGTFLAADEVADILPVGEQDKQRQGDRQPEEKRMVVKRRVTIKKEDAQRNRAGTEHRAQGDTAGQKQGASEHKNGASNRDRGNAQKHPRAGRDPLPSFEAHVDWEHMTDHRKQAAQNGGHDRLDRKWAEGKRSDHFGRERTLPQIDDRYHRPGLPPEHAKRVRPPGISAAVLTDINSLRDFSDQDCGGEGADKIREQEKWREDHEPSRRSTSASIARSTTATSRTAMAAPPGPAWAPKAGAASETIVEVWGN